MRFLQSRTEGETVYYIPPCTTTPHHPLPPFALRLLPFCLSLSPTISHPVIVSLSWGKLLAANIPVSHWAWTPMPCQAVSCRLASLSQTEVGLARLQGACHLPSPVSNIVSPIQCKTLGVGDGWWNQASGQLGVLRVCDFCQRDRTLAFRLIVTFQCYPYHCFGGGAIYSMCKMKLF